MQGQNIFVIENQGKAMHKRKDTGKIHIVVVTILLVMILAGCGQEKEQIPEQQEEQEEQTEVESEQETSQEILIQDETGCLIEEDSEHLYICGSYQLLKINKSTGEAVTLWENKKDYGELDCLFYQEGQGILVQDRIYFIEAYRDGESGMECKALSVIHTDGTGYQRLQKIDTYSPDMLIADGALYVEAPDENGNDGWLRYQVQEDGSLSESSRRRKLPKDALWHLEVHNDQYDSQLDANMLHLIDRETLEISKTIVYENNLININVITMDEDYVYVEYLKENDSKHKMEQVFEKVSLETYDRNVIFEREKITGMGIYNSSYSSDFVVKRGYLYYVGADDCKLYMMRRSLENPSGEEKLGEAFYDSGVSEVGTIQSYYERNYSVTSPDIWLTETDLEWLEVDERFAGAEKINLFLTENQNRIIEYENDNAEWLEEMVEEYGQEGFVHYTYSGTPSEITCFDERYLSFYQWEDDYMGGAHGQPCWVGLTFDLETGERLTLSDVIGNSEEELSSIVTEYFTAYIGENPEDFWQDALDTVRESVCYESDFYLTEEGIRFYFPPYALACFAAGFQEVTIPYDEFEMKISLQN